MSIRRYFSLFVLGLGIALVAASFQSTPGYMDAEYYLLGGLQLSEGMGFTEPILWNYLDDPEGLPHPSHAYWMPLASMLAAISLWLTPFDGFTGGRILFILLAGAVPPVTAWLAWTLFIHDAERIRRESAMLAGILAAFSGFYLSFLTVTDSFGIYMVLGALFLGIGGSEWTGNKGKWKKWLSLGIIAGMMHLARADGVVWLGVAFIGIVMEYGIRNKDWILGMGYCAGGYLLSMGVWLMRNISAFGTPLAPGGARALWVLNYDELFTFPASILTFERWWSVGVETIVRERMWALGQNLQTALGVQGEVFLLPLMLIGLWKLREKRTVQWGILAWALTLGVMTLAFPFSGARGGFFHSGAAVQPLFWAVVPIGLATFVEWGGRLRGWRVGQAQRVFGIGLIGLAMFLTGFILFTRGLPEEKNPGYLEIEQKLVEFGAKPGDVVMVNNPPGYFLASDRPAVVIPNGEVEGLLDAAERYRVRYVILDENIPAGVKALYENPIGTPDLAFLGALDDVFLFEVLR